MPQEQFHDTIDDPPLSTAPAEGVMGADPIETLQFLRMGLGAPDAEVTTAPSAPIRSYIEQYRNATAQLEAGEFVDRTRISRWEMHQTLQGGQYSAEELGDLMREMLHQKTVVKDRPSRYERTIWEVSYSEELETLRSVPSDKLLRLYASAEYGPELRAAIDHDMEKGHINSTGTIQFFEAMYGCPGKAAMLNDNGAYGNPQVKRLLMAPQVPGMLREEMRDELTQVETEQLTDLAEERMNQALDIFLGERHMASDEMIELRYEMGYNLMTHSTDSETGQFNYKYFLAALGSTMDAAKHLGVDNVLRLRHEAGIANLDYRHLGQFELMLNVLWDEKNFEGLKRTDPEEFNRQRKAHHEAIEGLKKGDVTVIFNDEMGDYNGAYRDLSQTFATDGWRTLAFGVHQPGDIYRTMLKLKKLGIAPSTLAIGAHGLPGATFFQKPVSAFAIAHGLRTSMDTDNLPSNTYVLGKTKGLARLVNEFMQDSRKTDDEDDTPQRRRLFLCSCFGAAPADMVKFVPTTRKDGSPGNQRAVHLRKRSSAQVITELSWDPKRYPKQSPNLDVYSGRPEVTAPQITEDGYTIRQFSGGTNGQPRRQEPFVKHFIDKRGRVTIVEENTVALHTPGPVVMEYTDDEENNFRW